MNPFETDDNPQGEPPNKKYRVDQSVWSATWL
jgi:hypothetical protein